MDNPVEDIGSVIHTLVSGSPHQQQGALEKYFAPDASFTHPFCRTGSFNGSRHLILAIYKWYKIMSPKIDLKINSIAFDEPNLILYVNISQVFAIWFLPFHRSRVTLTTVLRLTHPPSSSKYYIKSQDDLYQVGEFVKFFAPWGVGTSIVLLWHYFATFCCVILATLGQPLIWMEQKWYDESSKNHINGEGNQMIHPLSEKAEQNRRMLPYLNRFPDS